MTDNSAETLERDAYDYAPIDVGHAFIRSTGRHIYHHTRFEADVLKVGRPAFRGFNDRRAAALDLFDLEKIEQSFPKNKLPMNAWFAFLDVYGELHADSAYELEGIRRNSRAARDAIFDQNLSMQGYDAPTAIMAYDFFSRADPFFADKLPDVVPRLTEELALSAQSCTPFHRLIHERLKRDGDLLQEVLDDAPATSHRVAELFDRAMDEDELKIFMRLHLGGLDVGLSDGYTSPSVIFQKEEEQKKQKAEVDELLKNANNEIHNIRKQLLSDVVNRRQRRNVQQVAKKKFQHLLKSKRKLMHTTQDEISTLKKRNIAYMYKAKIDFGGAVRFEKPVLKEKRDEKPLPKPASLMKASGTLGDFSYYKPDGIDALLHARDMIDPGTAKMILDGLYTAYGEELAKANRVGRKLRQFLMAPRNSFLRRHLLDGILDPGDLTHIITDPHFEELFMERHEDFGSSLSTTVTLLIDNSGSMGGEKIALAFIAAERVSHWLSQSGIPVEILGFTTKHTESGIGMKYHILKDRYASHNRQTMEWLAAMLLDKNMGGTVIGEPVAWAYNRTLEAQEQRKIIFVLTDGENAGGKYDRHLRDVAAYIEERTPVEIIGIGIRSDVGKYFTNHIRLDSPHELIDSIAIRLRDAVDNMFSSAGRLKRKGVKIPSRKQIQRNRPIPV